MPTPSPDPRQLVLAALRNDKPTRSTFLGPISNDLVQHTYQRAVLTVCTALENAALPSELNSTGIRSQDLTPAHSIGEHLAATRRYFGLPC